MKPSSVLPLYFTLTLFVGVFGFHIFDFAYGMPFGLGDNLPIQDYEEAGLIFFIATLSYCLGSMMWGKSRALTFTRASEPQYRRISPVLSFIYIVTPAVLFFSSYGWDIFSRTEYIPENIGGFKFLGKVILVIMLFQLRAIVKSEILISFVYALYFFILLGYGSRMLALLPVINFISISMNSRSRGGFLGLAFHLLLCILFIMMVIQFRRLSMHGIFPYLKDFFINGIDLSIATFAVNYLTSFSYSLTAFLTSEIIYSKSYFFTSIHPMFGSIAGWPEIQDTLRVNTYVPYNGLSELAATGYGVLAMYFISVGFLLKGMERYFYRSFLGLMVVMCVSALFSVEILQYNLRSATRMLYYSILLLFSYSIYLNVRAFLPKKNDY
ncbi:hypothetical protein N9F33_03420 [Pseudomonadales bacterium]|nr:hypothetical protein [Pseudomonadales bacterium]